MKVNKQPHELEPGEYCQYRGLWYARTPGHPSFVNLAGNPITEHEDGTISAARPIEHEDNHGCWKGHLQRGVWESF